MWTGSLDDMGKQLDKLIVNNNNDARPGILARALGKQSIRSDISGLQKRKNLLLKDANKLSTSKRQVKDWEAWSNEAVDLVKDMTAAYHDIERVLNTSSQFFNRAQGPNSPAYISPTPSQLRGGYNSGR